MPASRVDLLDNLGAALGVASADDDLRPFGGERGRDRAADVAGSSGNDRGLVLESCAHLGIPSWVRCQPRAAVSAHASDWSRCRSSWWRDFTPSLRNALRRW